MKFDDLFQHFGDFGLYQALIFLLVRFTWFFDDSTAYNYITYRVDYWCDIPALSNLSHANQSYIASPLDDDGEYDQCQIYDLNYDSYSQEELDNWERLSDGAPTRKCDAWTYDTSEYILTTVSAVCMLYSIYTLLSSLLNAFIHSIIFRTWLLMK